jgi:CDP-diacylglycerol--glycerol-3-phosphate 3-phosphatidyltransferase
VTRVAGGRVLFAKGHERVDNRLTVPNILTLSRIAMALAAAGMARAGAFAPAVAVLILAALLDAFDGWYARAFSQRSHLGAHLDPLADKILMTVVFGWVGIDAAHPLVWMVLALVALREVAMTLLRSYSFRRHRRLIPASGLGRAKMFTQSMVGLTLLSVTHFLGVSIPLPVVVGCTVLVLVVSYASAVGYLRGMRRRGTAPVAAPLGVADGGERRVSVGR